MIQIQLLQVDQPHQLRRNQAFEGIRVVSNERTDHNMVRAVRKLIIRRLDTCWLGITVKHICI